jgi:hypothetical protein
MYKVQNAYKDASLMELNLMEMSDSRIIGLNAAELIVLLVLIIGFALVFAFAFMPEMEFMAMCHNIPNGDICQIALK